MQNVKCASYMFVEVEVGVIYAVCAPLALRVKILNYHPKSCDEII